MKYLCTFQEDYNQCSQLSVDRKYCQEGNTVCSFCKPENESGNKNVTGYVRKPRWYEKYYKKY